MASVSSIGSAGMADRIKAGAGALKPEDAGGDTGFMAMLDGLLQTVPTASGDASAADGRGKASGNASGRAGSESDSPAGDDKAAASIHGRVKAGSEHKDSVDADALNAAVDISTLSLPQPASSKAEPGSLSGEAASDSSSIDGSAVASDPRFSALLNRPQRHATGKTGADAAPAAAPVVSDGSHLTGLDKSKSLSDANTGRTIPTETPQAIKSRFGSQIAGDSGADARSTTDAQALASAGVALAASDRASSGSMDGGLQDKQDEAAIAIGASRRADAQTGSSKTTVATEDAGAASQARSAAADDAQASAAELSGTQVHILDGGKDADVAQLAAGGANTIPTASAVAQFQTPLQRQSPVQPQSGLQPPNASVLAFAATAVPRQVKGENTGSQTDAVATASNLKGHVAVKAVASGQEQAAASSQPSSQPAGAIDPSAQAPAAKPALGPEVAMVSFMSHAAARSDDQTAAAPAAQTVQAAAGPAIDPAATGALVGQSLPSAADVAAPSATASASHAFYATPAEQVAVIFQKAVATGDRSMSIALDPIELGRVQVKLDFGKDGQVQASVIADRPETLALLKNDHASLHTALQNAGLNPDQGSLSFSLRGEGDNSGRDASGAAGNGRGYRQKSQFTIDPADMASSQLVATPAGDGHLNMFV